MSGQSLSADQVARLVDRTDGWAAGLQLAGISLQDADDLDRVIDTVTGTDRSIGEYLLEEVVDQQDPAVCRFLLHTAILEWFTPELCEAVSGEISARTMIEELERRSLFLVRLDGEERYRYHHLFADLLRYRLRRDEPEQVGDLHRTAARWLLDHGHTMDAVDHLLAAGDHGEAFGVISSEGHQWFERGESATLVRWLGTIVDQDPEAAAAVSINLLAAQVAADDSAAAAETHRHLMRRRDLTLGENLAAAALHSLLVFRELSPEECIKSACFVRDNLPLADAEEVIDFLGLGGRDSVEVMGIYGEAWAHFVLGDLATSTELLRAGLSRPGCDYPMWRVYLLGALSLVRAWGGHSSEASSLATGAIGIAERFGAIHHEAVTSSRLALALVHLNRLELDEAATHLWPSRPIRTGTDGRASSSSISTVRWRPDVIALTDGPRRALALLREPSACVVESPLVAGANSAFQVHLRLQAGEIESAAAIIDTSSGCPGLAAAQVDIALSVGDRDSARRSSRALESRSRRTSRPTSPGCSGGPSCSTRKGSATSPGRRSERPSPWRRPSSSGGPSSKPRPPSRWSGEGPWSNGTLLKPLLSGQRLSLDARRDAQAHLVEPLTARELEILACLPGRARNHEVATSLYISANTLKSHLRSIYRKLDVADRDEAVTARH